MAKFWLVLLKNGLQAVVNALTERDAIQHVSREHDSEIEEVCECDADGKKLVKKKKEEEKKDV